MAHLANFELLGSKLTIAGYLRAAAAIDLQEGRREQAL